MISLYHLEGGEHPFYFAVIEGKTEKQLTEEKDGWPFPWVIGGMELKPHLSVVFQLAI
jgi:hypothetical protein